MAVEVLQRFELNGVVRLLVDGDPSGHIQAEAGAIALWTQDDGSELFFESKGGTDWVREGEAFPDVATLEGVRGSILMGVQPERRAPPGGNITTIPFLVPGRTNSVLEVQAGPPGQLGPVLELATETVSWAVLRTVTVASQVLNAPEGTLPVISDFRVGRGANLLLREDWVPVGFCDVDRDGWAPLRGNPMLRSPNTARLRLGAIGGAVGHEQVLVTLDLVVDVLRDDVFGPGLPGLGMVEPRRDDGAFPAVTASMAAAALVAGAALAIGLNRPNRPDRRLTRLNKRIEDLRSEIETGRPVSVLVKRRRLQALEAERARMTQGRGNVDL